MAEITIAELAQQLKTFQSDLDQTKKDFELKLNAAKTEAESWKKVAETKEAESKTFKEKAEAAEKEKTKAFAENRKNEDKTFLEGLKKEGRITPAMQEVAEKLMESMTSEDVIATFDMKDGKKVQHTQRSLFMDFVKSFRKSNAYTILSRSPEYTPETPDGTQGEVTIAEIHKDGQKVMARLDDVDLDRQAKAYQEEMRKIGVAVEYSEALITISKKISKK